MIYIYLNKENKGCVIRYGSKSLAYDREPDYEFTEEDFLNNGGNCYCDENGGLAWGVSPMPEIEYHEPTETELKIMEYESNLRATDYVALKLAEAADDEEKFSRLKEEYSDVLRQRKAWREYISENRG